MYRLFIVSFLASLPLAKSQDKDPGLLLSLLPYYWTSGRIVGFKGEVDRFDTEPTHWDSSLYYSGDILDMATDARQNRIFVVNGQSYSMNQIDGVDMNLNSYSTSSKVLHEGITYSGHVRIAFDWLSENVYWTDSQFNWICMLSIHLENKFLYKTVVHEGLDVPIALAVDPIKKYLFFAEHDQYSTFIERARLDGSRREIIISGYWVQDIVLDTEMDTLYWADNHENAIYRAKYDGSERKVVFRKHGFYAYMASLAISNEVICYSEYMYKYMLCFDKTSGQQYWYFNNFYFYDRPWVTRVFDEDNREPADHDCNGHTCEHMCVNTPEGAKCLCADGYKLDVNNTCEALHSLFAFGFVLANTTQLCMLERSVLTMESTEGRSMCFMQWNTTITFLAVNANKTLIFFTDDTGIWKYDATTNYTLRVALALKITGLTYDWNSEYLYWSEAEAMKIKSMPTILGQTAVATTVFSGIHNPSNLTINPHNDTLFWLSEFNGDYKIQGGTYDGLQKWNLATSPMLVRPAGVFFDVVTERVFWINNGIIRHMKSDGTDIQTLHNARRDTILLVYKDWILSTDGEDNIMINYANVANRDSNNIPTPEFPLITAMAILDSTTQRFEKGPCEINNGKCEQLCIPEANNQRVCRCGRGYELKSDGVNCTSFPMQNDFILVTDFSHRQLLQINLHNASHIVTIDIKDTMQPIASAYSVALKQVYWSDHITFEMRKADLSGKNSETIYKPGTYFVYSMTIDPSTENIYYCADPGYYYDKSYIGIINPRDGKHKTLLDDMDNVYSVAVYPAEGLLFYVEAGYYAYTGYIGKMQMDGSSNTPIVPTDVVVPNSVAIDFPRDGKEARVYWSDLWIETIYSVDLDGNDRKELIHDPTSMMAHIAIAGGFVYYTSTHKQYITKVDINDGRMVDWMDHTVDFGRLESIDVYPGDPVPVHSVCSVKNGGCSTFCLPSNPTARRCACEDGMELTSDMRTCHNVKKCDESVLNGKLSSDCTGYVNVSCSYTCNPGYAKVSGENVICLDSKTGNAAWNVDLHHLCMVATTSKPTTPKPTTPTPTPKPIVQTTTPMKTITAGTSGIETGVFIAVILVMFVLFLAVFIIGFFLMRRRRSANLFAHAKFVNPGNITLDASSAENAYGNDNGVTKSNTSGIGIENPCYNAKTDPSFAGAYENTSKQVQSVNLEVPIKS